MDPKELIELLKANRPKPRRGIDEFPEHIKARLKELGEAKTQELLDEIAQRDYAQILYEDLKPRMPADLSSLVDEGAIAIGEVTDDLPDAKTIILEPGGYAIIFNSGLRSFIYRVARVFATRMQPSQDMRTHHESIRFEETARIVAEIFWWYRDITAAFGPDYKIAKEQMLLAHYLATEAEIFLLAHEFGHVIQDIGKRHGRDFATLEAAMSGMGTDHAEEHISDRVAVGLVMGSADTKTMAEHPEWTYAGVEFALQIYQGMELLDVQFQDSHPSAKSRLEYIREFVKSNCESEESWSALSSVARPINEVFQNIISLLKHPKPDFTSWRHKEGQLVLRRFRELLDECAESDVPDYARFYGEAGPIFDRGYPDLIMDEVRNVTEEFIQVMVGQDRSTQAGKKHKRYKLLFGFITQYVPETVRPAYMSIIDLSSRPG